MTANTPSSRKAKGRKFQQAILEDLLQALPIAPGDVLSTAMGQAGCDLYLSPAARTTFPFGVECKNVERLALWDAWKQCAGNATAAELTPLLVVRRNHEDALAILRWADLLALIGQRCENVADCPVLRGEDARRFHEALQRPPEISEAARQLIRHASRLASEGDPRWQNLADGLTGGRV